MNARSLRVGMVGAGFVSQHHLMAWRTLVGQAQVVAIADFAILAIIIFRST